MPRSRRLRRGTVGSAVVEFAFVFPLILLLVFGIFDFGRIFYIRLTLQSAVREASRLTITGNQLPDPENPGEFLSRVESIVHTIQTVAPALAVTAEHVSIIGPSGEGDPGGPGDLVTIRVDYDIEVVTPVVKSIFPNGMYPCSVYMIAKNELFPEA